MQLGENVVAPSMDSNVDEIMKCEKGDKEIDRKDTHQERDRIIIYRKYNRYVSQVKDLLDEEHILLSSFMVSLVVPKHMTKIIVTPKYLVTLMVLTNLHKLKHPSEI